MCLENFENDHGQFVSFRYMYTHMHTHTHSPVPFDSSVSYKFWMFKKLTVLRSETLQFTAY